MLIGSGIGLGRFISCGSFILLCNEVFGVSCFEKVAARDVDFFHQKCKNLTFCNGGFCLKFSYLAQKVRL
jgi:hypothetical protein